MTSSVSLLIALMAFEVAGTLDVSDEALAYVREADSGNGATIDLENTPRLAIDLEWPTTALGFDYAPRFLWTEVLGPDPSPTLVLHTGGAWWSWHAPRLLISLGQTVAVGDQSFARLSVDRGIGAADTPGAVPGAAAAPTDGAPLTPGLDLLPAATIVRVANAESSASLRYQLSRRVSIELRPSYGISGGIDAAAQLGLPQQRVARTEVSFDYRASRRDQLGTELAVARIWTSNGYDHWLSTAMESWSRSFTPSSGGQLGAGVAASDTTGPLDVRSNELGPIAAGSVWQTLVVQRVQVHLESSAGYSPHVNVLSGTLQRRLFASAGASATVNRSSIRVELGATQTFPNDAPDAAQSITADLVLERALVDWLVAELGGQIIWQSLGGGSALTSAGSRSMLYAGLRGQVPPVRF